jgi:hypothetical protein
VGRKLLAVAACLASSGVLASCDIAYSLEVWNLQAPPVRVVVNDREVGTIACRAGRIVLRPRLGNPPLPWHVEVLREDGTLFQAVDIAASETGDQKLVVLEVGLVTLPPVKQEELRAFELMDCPKQWPI